ncbi:hypothetical protein Ahu01nite_036530 [Winogradskya humida]|uniref:WD40 repeat protein n=1 Tax=Winogradskya humida TaxID=113566 RepID=A0ABQ3ZPP1_9ACTN|nr:hypothetical protein Ahu01nite_036530 [Actinoplanes humidus]
MGGDSRVAGLKTLVAYVRDGSVYVSKGKGEVKVAGGRGWSRPRWSPDGDLIAALKGSQLWTMKADGTGKRHVTTRAASGPSWAPDGRAIAFSSVSCSGGPGVYAISATEADAVPEVLFPSYCRDEELPPEPVVTAAEAKGSVKERLRGDDAVAWSPDGSKVAFRGGDCESVYDSCLTVGDVASGGERTVAAYGGGGLQNSGFAVVPSWRGDGRRLAWTAYERGNRPLHVVEYDTVSGVRRDVGVTQDREFAYLDESRGVVTGSFKGGSWVMIVDLDGGGRVAFHRGSQPSVQPGK